MIGTMLYSNHHDTTARDALTILVLGILFGVLFALCGVELVDASTPRGCICGVQR
jgi:hypothetical protein